MNAVNPTDELKEAKRLQQALRKNPNDIASLLKLAVKLKDQELKRKILNRVLRLDPVNQAARDMLLKMDRDELSGGVSQSRHASISTIPNSAAIGSLEESSKKLLILRYPLFPQIIIAGLMAITLAFCLAALRDPNALPVFGSFFLFLIIPLWFVSAVVKVGHSGFMISRLFGISKQEVAWADIVTIKSIKIGQGMRLSDREGKLVTISGQLHGYPALVEILQKIRPDLFSTDKGTKAFQKSFGPKYGSLAPLCLGFLIFVGSISSGQFLPAIMSVFIVFLGWRMGVSAPYMIKVEGNKLQTRSFLKSQQLNAQQIKNIHMVSLRNIRGVRKNFIQIESCEGRLFRLSGFPEGNEIMYGFLKNWWKAYQGK